LENRGDLCIFVSYLEDHGFDVYQLFNINSKKIVESRDVRWLGKYLSELNNNELVEIEDSDFGMAPAINSDPNKPKTLKQAWNHESKAEKEGWKNAIKKELKSMEEQKVWEIVEEKEIPKDRNPIGCKCVFKKK
jgi:hypothetical protein